MVESQQMSDKNKSLMQGPCQALSAYHLWKVAPVVYNSSRFIWRNIS